MKIIHVLLLAVPGIFVRQEFHVLQTDETMALRHRLFAKALRVAENGSVMLCIMGKTHRTMENPRENGG